MDITLTDLPIDINLIIINNLSDDKSSIRTLNMVCKKFNNIIKETNIPLLSVEEKNRIKKRFLNIRFTSRITDIFEKYKNEFPFTQFKNPGYICKFLLEETYSDDYDIIYEFDYCWRMLSELNGYYIGCMYNHDILTSTFAKYLLTLPKEINYYNYDEGCDDDYDDDDKPDPEIINKKYIIIDWTVYTQDYLNLLLDLMNNNNLKFSLDEFNSVIEGLSTQKKLLDNNFYNYLNFVKETEYKRIIVYVYEKFIELFNTCNRYYDQDFISDNMLKMYLNDYALGDYSLCSNIFNFNYKKISIKLDIVKEHLYLIDVSNKNNNDYVNINIIVPTLTQ